MDIGQLDAALNALDVLRVKSKPNGDFDSVVRDGVDVGLVRAQTNPLTGGIDLLLPTGRAPVNGLRTTPVRIVTFGDSTANCGSVQNTPNPTQQDVSKVVAVSWQPAADVSLGISGDKFATSYFYPQAYLVGNCGVSGDTTSAMLARDQAAEATNRFAMTDALNLAPHVILLRGGSINDISGATPATIDTLFAATLDRHTRIINRALSAGVPVIDCGIYGYSGAATYPDAVRACLLKLNVAFSAVAESSGGMVQFINWTGILADSSGAYLPGMSTDGTHLNFNAQLLAGQEEAKVLARLFGRSSGPRYPGKNLITNALMANTTVPAYGTELATGFTINATIATRQNAKIETIDGKRYQTCEFVLGAGTNRLQMYAPFNPSSAGPFQITAGDIYGFEFDAIIKGLNGLPINPVLPAGIYGQVKIVNTVTSKGVYVNRTAFSNCAPMANGFSAHISLPPIQIDEVSANLHPSVSTFGIELQTTDSAGVIKMGIANPRIVKLNQAMLTS